MAYVKQVAIGTDVYDIKAKAYDGLVPVANGGTGADNATDAKVNLNLCASGQNARVCNFSAATQIWGLRANCVNSNSTNYNEHDISLITYDTRLALYDHTAGGTVWSIAPDDYVQKTGSTMTGQLKTSFNQSVAMGAYGASATTIEDLCTELRYSSGVAGSANITTAYTKDNVTIATGWYNFLWIPHRSGGSNGTAVGDNCNYGSLYLSGMTVSGFYMIRYASQAIAELKNLYAIAHNHDSVYLKLSGGTMTSTGQVLKEGQSKSWYNGRDAAIIRQTTYGGYCPAVSMKTTNGSWEIGVYSSNNLHFCYVPDASYTGSTNSNTVSSAKIGPDGKVYGAVWNDFAEFRVGQNNPGKVMVENGDDTISISNKRLQPGAMICSDTYGFSIGETEKCKCPIAIAGRVLAYTYEPRDEYKNNIGQAVCSGPDGTVSLMTKDEVKEYPECVIGYISAVPNYEEWGTGKVKVDGRVWIKVK